MLTSTLPVRFALDFLGVEEFHQGDVFVANDPYHGGGHLPDYNVFAPVVVDGHLVLIASIQCHHGDTGGAVPGGYNVTAADIWGEGVRWPVVKVLDRGVERNDVLYALQVNNRLEGYLGDLRAQIGAAKQAADRLAELVERYGVDMIESAVDHMIDYAGRALRRGDRGLARRRLRGRRLRRPRPAGQPRHPSAREDHRRWPEADHRLHRFATSDKSCKPGRPTATPGATRWPSWPP